MILSNLAYSERYYSLNPVFEKVFNFIKNKNWQNAELGKIELDGENIFITNAQPDGLSKENQVLEYHKKYLDIHILLEGEETIGWKNLPDCTQEEKPFDSEADFGTYKDQPTAYITLKPNDFAIIYPEDAHAPIIGNGKIKKLVVKIKV
ncbi:MAG: YhcH/YjgK/YiaL family protein [Capnocytophaga sp.]|nr:YhcH/YjgK/YiaL family protein [Capnocytophaga sp.]